MLSRFVPLALMACLACGGGATKQAPAEAPSSPGRPAGVDACALLTREEITAALGWTPDSAATQGYGTTGTCTWAGPGAAEQLSLLVGQGMQDMSTSAAMASWRAEQYKNYAVTDAIVEPVEGLGVPAIRNELAGLVAIEMAIKGQLVTVSSIADFEKVKGLAGLVAGRMK